VVALLLVASASSASHAAPDRLPKDEGWLAVRSGDLLVLGNVPEAKLREVATRTEQFRRAIRELNPALTLDTSVPSRLYAFKSEKGFAPYKPAGARGFHLATPHANFVAVNLTPPSVTRGRAELRWLDPYAHYPYRDLYHELTHFLLEQHFPTLPAWLDEGLAEYYETFTVKSDHVDVGRFTQWVVVYLTQVDSAPVSTLFEADRRTDDELIHTPSFYAFSWAVVHYLLHGEEARLREFHAYARWLQRGTPRELAYARAFGVLQIPLINEARAYVARREIPYGRIDLALTDLEVTSPAVELSRPEVLTHLGELLVELGEIEPATEHFREALRLDPAFARASFGLALVEEAQGEFDGAVADYERAIAREPKVPLYHVRLGHNRLTRAKSVPLSEAGGPETRATLVSQARASFRRALELDGRLVEPRIELGECYAEDAEFDGEGIRVLTDVRSAAPGRTEIPFLLGLLDMRGDNEEQARQRMRESLKGYPFPCLDLLSSEISATLERPDYPLSTISRPLWRLAELTLALPRTSSALPDGLGWEDLAVPLERLRLRTLELGARLQIHDGLGSEVAERLRGQLESATGEVERELLGSLLAAAEGAANTSPGSPEYPSVETEARSPE
jgi:tetratricopeptide (TPR) repeat protein